MEFDVLMKCLADESGVPEGFAADEDGVVRIGSGENSSIAFAEIDEMRSVLIWSRVRDLPPQGAEPLKDELLKANFMGRALGGGTLSLSDDGGIYLHRILPLQILDGDGFINEVTLFVGHLRDWRRLLRAYEAMEKPGADKSTTDLPPVGVGRFLKV